jgi:hypothetical protein
MQQEGYTHGCGHFNNLSLHVPGSVKIKTTTKGSSLKDKSYTLSLYQLTCDTVSSRCQKNFTVQQLALDSIPMECMYIM